MIVFRKSILALAVLTAGGVPVAIVHVNMSHHATAGGQKMPIFERDIQPLLQSTCVRCHGEKHSGDLDLRTLSGLLKGGESGPVIVPGHANKSLLFKKIHEGLMPPDKKGVLKVEQIATIRRWIDAGAPSSAGNTVKAPAVTQHDIEPLMLMRCAVCHGLRKQEGGLDLRTKAAMLKGGKSGPAIVLGKPPAQDMAEYHFPKDDHRGKVWHGIAGLATLVTILVASIFGILRFRDVH